MFNYTKYYKATANLYHYNLFFATFFIKILQSI